MISWQHIARQASCYAVFFTAIGYFSNSPEYKQLENDQATIKLSLRHAGKILGECKFYTKEELMKLPPNMRIAKVCPRERSPLYIELIIDDNLFYSDILQPGGWQKDGISSLYRRFTVPSGNMKIDVRMKDHINQDFAYRLEKSVRLKPAQTLVIDFKNTDKKFKFM